VLFTHGHRGKVDQLSMMFESEANKAAMKANNLHWPHSSMHCTLDVAHCYIEHGALNTEH